MSSLRLTLAMLSLLALLPPATNARPTSVGPGMPGSAPVLHCPPPAEQLFADPAADANPLASVDVQAIPRSIVYYGCGTKSYPLVEAAPDTVFAKFINLGTDTAYDTDVKVRIGGSLYGSGTVSSIGPNSMDTVEVGLEVVTPAFDASRLYFDIEGYNPEDLLHDNDTSHYDDWSFPRGTQAAEGFDYIETFPPPGWTVIDNNGGTTTWNWYVGGGWEHSGLLLAATEYDPIGHDEWLITPVFTPGTARGDSLGCFVASGDPAWLDSLQVWAMLGPTIQDTIPGGKLFDGLVPFGPPYTEIKMSLDAYDGLDIHLGFRSCKEFNNAFLLLDDVWFEADAPHDIAVEGLTAPDTVLAGVPFPSSFLLTNNSVTPVPGGWWARIELFDSLDVLADGDSLRVESSLAPMESRALAFPGLTAPAPGAYRLRAGHDYAFDTDPANDTVGQSVYARAAPALPSGWHELTSMPNTPTDRAVKRGGWLAQDSSGHIYAAKGYRTGDFYRYDPGPDSWTTLARIGDGTRGPNESDKGGKGACDGVRYIYATLGNNTTWFLRYDIWTNTWLDMAKVPEGPRNKKVKGGTDVVYVEKDSVGWVYLLKGYDTEFYKYNIAADEWVTLDNAPEGIKPKYKRGSWLAYDGTRYIYCHKANYYDRGRVPLQHEMYRYDVLADSWDAPTIPGMPLWGLHDGAQKKKKSKDGGTAAWYDGRIYALKGGNTQQFWMYDVGGDSWTALDTVPSNGSTGRKKRVKYGADILSYGGGVFYALKGNKTRELWRWVEETPYAARSTPYAGQEVESGVGRQASGLLHIAPNPLSGRFATVHYSLPAPGAAKARVYDIAGRERLSVASSVWRQASSLVLDLGRLEAGVYLVRLESPGYSATRKLVVQ